MANDFSKEELTVFEEVHDTFEKTLTMSQRAGRYNMGEIEGERHSDTVWRPQPFIALNQDGLDLTGNTADDLQRLVVPARVTTHKNVLWQLDALEARDPWNQSQQNRAAGQRLAAEVQMALARMVSDTSQLVVKRGTLVGYSDFAECEARLTEIGVDPGGRSMFLNTRDKNAVADNLALRQDVGPQRVEAAISSSELRPYAGFGMFSEDLMPTLGAAAGGAITVSGAGQAHTPVADSVVAGGERAHVDNRSQLLTVSATANVAIGDAFEIANVNACHLITKEDTGIPFTGRVWEIVDGTTLRVSAMVDSGPYQNVVTGPADAAPFTWLNTTAGQVNVFWKDNSVEILPGRISTSQLSQGGIGIMSSSTTQGITITMMRSSDMRSTVTEYRFHIYFGVANLQPLFNGVLLSGQA